MDETLKFWITALGAAGITLLGAFIGALWKSYRDHLTWLRAERLQAYLPILEMNAQMIRALAIIEKAQKDPTGEMAVELGQAEKLVAIAMETTPATVSRLELLGPRSVRKQFTKVAEALKTTDLETFRPASGRLSKRMTRALRSA